MGNSLGALVVRLGLDAAEFTSGLTKSEYEAQKFAKKLEQGIASAGRAVGIAMAGIGAAAAGAFVVLQREIDNIAGFKQLSEQIGDTAEAISGLRTASATSGVAMETIAAASIKLTAGLSKTDDESKGAAAAIKAIGINMDEFLRLSPVAQLEKIAETLAKFEDGAGKTAFAVAAFGKAGAAALPFLNDLADAGGRNVKLTQEQIEAADQYTKQQARVKAELQDLIRIVAIESLPAFTAFIGALTDTAKAMFGLDKATSGLKQNDVREWATSTATAVAFVVDAGEGVARVFEVAGKTLGGFFAAKDALGGGNIVSALRILKENARDVDAALNRPLFSDRLAARMAAPLPAAAAARPALDPRSFAANTGSSGAAKGADEFARAMENVAKSTAVAQAELDAIMAGTDGLTQAQKALAGIMADKVWATYTEQERASLTVLYERYDAVLRATDAEKKRREEFEKSIDAMHKQADAETKARESAVASVASYERQNKIMGRQIDIIGQSTVAREKLAAAIEYERERDEALAKGRIGEAAQLEQLYQARLKLIDAADLANKALDEQRKQEQFIDDIGDAFGRAAEDAVAFGKSAKDVLKSLEQDLLRLGTRKFVTEPIANAFSSALGGSGSGGGGGDWMSMLLKLGSAFAGGGTSSGWTSGYDLPMGSFASGTNFAPGGWAKVHKDEIINLPRGSQVIPANDARQMRGGTIVNQYITNMPGVTRQSASQSAGESSRRLQQHYARDS